MAPRLPLTHTLTAQRQPPNLSCLPAPLSAFTFAAPPLLAACATPLPTPRLPPLPCPQPMPSWSSSLWWTPRNQIRWVAGAGCGLARAGVGCGVVRATAWAACRLPAQTEHGCSRRGVPCVLPSSESTPVPPPVPPVPPVPQVEKTKVIKNTLNPVWNERHWLLVQVRGGRQQGRGHSEPCCMGWEDRAVSK